MTDRKDRFESRAIAPWFVERPVQAVNYRVNRRPLLQGNLFGEQPENFLDHLEAVLLFGFEVAIGRRGDRRWQLGNRRIDPKRRFLAGVIGWESEQLREEDHFDDVKAEWVPGVATTSQVALSPFVIEARSRRLFIMKHSSFAETTLATVFRTILNEGERQREIGQMTDWDVQPMLDELEFEAWLSEIAILDKVTFVARLPNPDAEESFRELDEHIRKMRAGEMRHELKAADEDAGLATDFTADRLSLGLLEMSKRGFAAITARARDSASRIRTFVQRNAARHNTIEVQADSYNDARDELAARAVEWVEQEEDA
jgi:hypothetical protein